MGASTTLCVFLSMFLLIGLVGCTGGERLATCSRDLGSCQLERENYSTQLSACRLDKAKVEGQNQELNRSMVRLEKDNADWKRAAQSCQDDLSDLQKALVGVGIGSFAFQVAFAIAFACIGKSLDDVRRFKSQVWTIWGLAWLVIAAIFFFLWI